MNLAHSQEEGPQEDEEEKEEKIYVRVRPIKIQGLTSAGKQRLSRMTLSVIMRNDEVEILLGDNIDIDIDGVTVLNLSMIGQEVKWGTSTQGHKLKFTLKEANTDFVVNQVLADRVSKRRLVYQSSKMLERLFGEPLSEGIEEVLIRADEESKNDKDDKKVKPDKQNEDDEGLEDEEEGPTGQEKASGEEEEDEDEELAPEEKPEKKKKKEVAISDFESPDLDLEKSGSGGRSKGESGRFFQKFSYELHFEQETLNSVDIIDVDNTVSRLGPKIHLDIYPNGENGHFIHNSLAYYKVISESDYDFDPRLKVGSSYVLNGFSRRFHVYVGGGYETFSFVNLAKKGRGLQSWKNSFIWLKGGINWHVASPYNLKTNIGLEYGQSLLGTSDFGIENDDASINLEGTQLSAFVSQQVWGRFYVSLSYKTQEVTAVSLQELNNKHSIFGLSVSYR